MESKEPATGHQQNRKAYRAPELRRYGTLAEVTATVGNTGNMDGGTGQMNQTRV
jgi:hypothetical protein